jgi:hypothetical protein
LVLLVAPWIACAACVSEKGQREDAATPDTGAAEHDASSSEEAGLGDASDAADSGDPSDAGDTGGADPCAALDCGEHGHCELSEAVAACVCEDGFEGESCDVCGTGRGLASDGSCGPLCEIDSAPACGAHGTCVAGETEASCECTHPFAGALCEGCATGFRLDAGQCVPDCGDCGGHAYCDGTLMVPACACVTGYGNGGSGCVWVGGGENGGGLLDGTFDDPSVWTTRLATVASGRATFVNTLVNGQCELGAIEQTFQMPALADAEPLALDLTVSTSCSSTDPAACPALQLEIDDKVTRVEVPGGGGATKTLTVCLGDAAFGGEVRLRVRPSLAKESFQTPGSFDCMSDAWPALEALRIRVADAAECAFDEGIPNGLFDDGAGWGLQSASIAGGKLTVQSGGSATARIVVPAPLRVASPALRLNPDASSFGGLRVALGGLIFGQASWSMGSSSPIVLCLPDWAHGTGQEIGLSAANADSTLEGLAIVSDPRCADGNLDSGFERTFSDGSLFGNGSWLDAATGQGFVVSDSAHSGSRCLRLTSYATILRAVVRVPERQPGFDPAFSFWERVTGSVGAETLLYPFLDPGTRIAVSSQAWLRSLTCLDRAWAGQVTPVTVLPGIVSGTGGTVELDDLEPVLTDTCP